MPRLVWTCVRAVAMITALAGVLAACSDSGGGSSTGPSESLSTGVTGPDDQRTVGRGPAASGLVAAVDASQIQVQSETSQTTVRYTSSTRFTETRTASRSAIKVGMCAVATMASDSTDADSITVSAPANGSCADGFGGPAGGRLQPGGREPSGTASFVPGGGPSGAPPSGFPGRGRSVGDIAAGRITAVSGGTVTIAATTRGGSQSSSPTTEPKTLTLTSSTTYREIASATKSALKVGKCATAEGTTDSTGAVTARAIALSPATSGRCTLTFGRRTNG